MADDPVPSRKASVLCSECGEDVCTVRDTSRAWTHRSRVVPKVVWLAIFLGWIVLCVWSGGVSVSHTPSVVKWDPFTSSNYWSSASLHSSRPGLGIAGEEVYVSTQDLWDVIGGDDDAVVRFVENLNEAHEQNLDIDSNSRLGAVERVQFAWHEPAGTLSEMRIYYFGGLLLWTNEHVMLHDIRDHGSVGRDEYREVRGSEGWTLWPALGHTKITHDGAIDRSWRVNVLGVIQLVSVCLVGAWLVGLIIWLIGVSKPKRSRIQLGVFFLLLVSACVLVLIDAGRKQYESGDGREVSLSGSYTLGYLDQVFGDQDKLVAFCEDLLDLVPAEYEGELLLAQAWAYNTEEDPSDIQWDDVSLTEVFIKVWDFARFGYTRYEFEQIEDAHGMHVFEDWPIWDSLFRYGHLDFQWGSLEKQSNIDFTFFAWLMIGVMLWSLWAALHWSARFMFRRIQRRRVRRDQCIFCAYPLSDEGKKARSLET